MIPAGRPTGRIPSRPTSPGKGRLKKNRSPAGRRPILKNGTKPIRTEDDTKMAVNKPAGDNARKGAVKKRSQLKTKLGGVTAFTKRNKKGGEFMAVKKPAKGKNAAKKF